MRLDLTTDIAPGIDLAAPEIQARVRAARQQANDQLIATGIAELRRSGAVTRDAAEHAHVTVTADGVVTFAFSTARGRRFSATVPHVARDPH